MRSLAIRCACCLSLAIGAISLGAARPIASAMGAPPELHMALQKTEPAMDSTVTVAPTMLKLYWTQSPRIEVTQVRLWSAANKRVTLGTPKLSDASQLVLEVPITAPVADGVYTVTWRTAGDDGHIMNGTYKFTYRADR